MVTAALEGAAMVPLLDCLSPHACTFHTFATQTPTAKVEALITSAVTVVTTRAKGITTV